MPRAQTYNKGVNDGKGKKGLQSVLHQNSSPVHESPVLQVVVAAVPQADKAKGQTGGQHFVERAVTRSSQGDIDVSGRGRNKKEGRKKERLNKRFNIAH